MSWKTDLPPSQVNFMQDIINQVPETHGAREMFERVLDNIAAPKGETEKRLRKLDALEAGGVDNWENYDFALEDAGINGDGSEADDDEG